MTTMYESYFHFKKKPFELVPNPEFLYLSGTHKKAMTYINYGMMERVGFILLTGEVGSGKTTLIRDLIKRLNHDVTLSRVFMTTVDSEQLLSMINEDFGLESTGKSKVILLKELYAFLTREYEQGHQVLLIIDEAQNFPVSLLEEVRMLSNLETDDTKLLQIILIGQPELRDTLARPELRQLRQRISIACHLSPLTRAETEAYVYHRLTTAGNRDALRFTPEAMDRLHACSSGIPRLVNILGNFLLLTAFTERTHEVTAEMVSDIADGVGIVPRADTGQTAAGARALLRALGVPPGSPAAGTARMTRNGAEATDARKG